MSALLLMSCDPRADGGLAALTGGAGLLVLLHPSAPAPPVGSA